MGELKRSNARIVGSNLVRGKNVNTSFSVLCRPVQIDAKGTP
jgi:hypothetical protein